MYSEVEPTFAVAARWPPSSAKGSAMAISAFPYRLIMGTPEI